MCIFKWGKIGRVSPFLDLALIKYNSINQQQYNKSTPASFLRARLFSSYQYLFLIIFIIIIVAIDLMIIILKSTNNIEIFITNYGYFLIAFQHLRFLFNQPVSTKSKYFNFFNFRIIEYESFLLAYRIYFRLLSTVRLNFYCFRQNLMDIISRLLLKINFLFDGH